MKKIALLLAFVLLLCAGCGVPAQEPETVTADSYVGLWETAQSPELTTQLRALMDRAFETFTGAQYEPVAYLARQNDSGMNHRFLCKTTSVLPDGTQTYSIVELHEDRSGSVRITDIVDSVVPTNLHDGENLSGGWTQPESPLVTDDLRAALLSTGAENEPVACLSMQVVAGMQYCLLCKAADADNAYTFVYLVVDPQGEARLTDAVRFTDGSDNETR